jgi:hypothetical protein
MVSAFEVGVRQKPRKVTACKQSWALAGETQYPLEARKLRRLAFPISESCWEEVIDILQKCTGFCITHDQVPSQSLTKEVGAITEALGKNCPS